MLGLPEKLFESGGELVCIDLPNPRDLNLRIPSGNEAAIDAGGLKTSELDWKILNF